MYAVEAAVHVISGNIVIICTCKNKAKYLPCITCDCIGKTQTNDV